MRNRKGCVWVVLGLVWASCGAVTKATEGQEPNYLFEVSSSYIRWSEPSRPVEGGAVIPTHAAGLSVPIDSLQAGDYKASRDPRRLEDTDEKEEHKYLQAHWLAASLSEQQKHFLREAEDKVISVRPGTSLDSRMRPKGLYITLFAVSEEDARKMAVAFIDYVDKQHAWRRQEAEESLERLRAKMPALEKEVSEAEGALEKLTQRQAEIKATTAYQELGQAKKAVEDLTAVLNTLQVDIKGMEGEIAAIREQDAYVKNLGGSIVPHLLQMKVEAQIELAGALARREAAKEQQKIPLEFWRLNTQEQEAREALRGGQSELNGTKSSIADLEGKLASPPAKWGPLQIYGGKVEIRPVEVEG